MAVNRMLGAIGEQPVSSLIPPQPPEAFVAQSVLAEVSVMVQSEGWNFNTFPHYSLAFSPDGTVPLPSNCLQATFPTDLYPDRRYIVRGNRVFDTVEQSFTIRTQGEWQEGLLCTAIMAVPFEDLPEIAINYLVYRATRVFSNRITGSQVVNQLTAQEEGQLRAALRAWDMGNTQANIIGGGPWDRGDAIPTYLPKQGIGQARRLN
jgi:hypothetical protein